MVVGRHVWKRGWSLATLLVCGATAQGAGQGNGAITGVMEDESGGIMPGVTATAVSEATAAIRTAVSDGEGRFTIMDLRVGRYRLRGVLPGFSSEIAFVTVEAGETSTADLLLSIAPLTETVTVIGAQRSTRPASDWPPHPSCEPPPRHDLRFGYDGRWGDVDVRPFVGFDNIFDDRYNSSAITNVFGGSYYEPFPGARSMRGSRSAPALGSFLDATRSRGHT